MTASERRRPESDWSDEGRSDHYHPLANGLGRAAEQGDTAAVRSLLAGGAEVDAWVLGGRRALDLAVCAGHAEVVRLLLAAGADPRVDAGPYGEATPLALAAMLGHTEVARALLDAGAPPGGPAGRVGHVPLISAAVALETGDPETVDLLLDRGADIEETKRDRTPLDWAARFGCPATVERLLARGAALTERTFREGAEGERFTADAASGTARPAYKVVRAQLMAAWESRRPIPDVRDPQDR
ncbi:MULTISPECIES: ankyrin repeat domain-containing protein [unclassified Streptomyces]|uniref:ankyrin repeat domain-containing protein n=1 Tax=unclassified Streptomyces TaxID=2593676 RepID=UPI00069005C2|nr:MULTISPECIES: ankyrin repeat domain-containing protein [unclassified Streptomyces]